MTKVDVVIYFHPKYRAQLFNLQQVQHQVTNRKPDTISVKVLAVLVLSSVIQSAVPVPVY